MFFFQEQEAKRLREAADGAGILANIWGYFTGGGNAKHECQSDLIQANVNANSDATIEANANNNAANRSAEENVLEIVFELVFVSRVVCRC